MKRRTFVYSALVVGAGLGVTGIYFRNNETRWKSQPLGYPYILSGICDVETLRKIGTAYRKLVPEENSKEKLLNELNAGLTTRQLNSDRASLVNELELKVESDFKDHKLVTIAGWVLSKTEARQCALLSLS